MYVISLVSKFAEFKNWNFGERIFSFLFEILKTFFRSSCHVSILTLSWFDLFLFQTVWYKEGYRCHVVESISTPLLRFWSTFNPVQAVVWIFLVGNRSIHLQQLLRNNCGESSMIHSSFRISTLPHRRNQQVYLIIRGYPHLRPSFRIQRKLYRHHTIWLTQS